MSGTPSVRCRPLAPADWPALAQLFGPRGACGGCWCMLWRAPYGGARIVEGYPVASRDGAAVSPTFAWTGVPRMFERAGFERHRLASGRLVYRLRTS